MNQQLKKATEHWGYVAPIASYPTSEKEYVRLTKRLDELLDMVGNDQNHSLNSLIDVISCLVTTYDAEHYNISEASGIDALKYLMHEHKLKQSDLSEIGSQGVVSEILNGKRELNLRQVKLLAKKFNVSPETFI